jgi:hypothetical protein
MRISISVTVLLLLFSGYILAGTEQSRPEPSEHEASISLDSDDVEPVLFRVSSLMTAGFSRSAARVLANRINAQPVESERAYTYKVTYRGRTIRLRVIAFMDDVNAPDLSFFTTADAARAIQGELEAYFKAQNK